MHSVGESPDCKCSIRGSRLIIDNVSYTLPQLENFKYKISDERKIIIEPSTSGTLENSLNPGKIEDRLEHLTRKRKYNPRVTGLVEAIRGDKRETLMETQVWRTISERKVVSIFFGNHTWPLKQLYSL